MTIIELKGEVDAKLEILGRVLFQEDKPFDLKEKLNDVGLHQFQFGPATAVIAIDGDKLALGVNFMGFPILSDHFEISDLLGADHSKSFDYKLVGDEFKLTISLTEA